MTSTPVATPHPRASRELRAPFSVERWALLFALVAVVAVCAIFLPQFRNSNLIITMINAQSIILLLALTATVVLRTGDFDLSISQVMVGSAATVAVLSGAGLSPAVIIPTVLAGGLLVGLINGLLVVWVGVDSFVATLGSFTALAGFSYLITGNRVIAGVPDIFITLAREPFLGIPMVTWIAWILVVVLWYVYDLTPVGRFMIFTGGNRDAARLSGISVTRVRTGAFLVSGLLAAGIGILFAGYFGSVDPSVGGQYMLQPFAAAYLGATAITVGRFNAWGTVVALYLLTTGITALQLLGAQSWVTNLFYGLALMLSVAAAKIAGKRRGRVAS